jgi:hypothetical protein
MIAYTLFQPVAELLVFLVIDWLDRDGKDYQDIRA